MIRVSSDRAATMVADQMAVRAASTGTCTERGITIRRHADGGWSVSGGGEGPRPCPSECEAVVELRRRLRRGGGL